MAENGAGRGFAPRLIGADGDLVATLRPAVSRPAQITGTQLRALWDGVVDSNGVARLDRLDLAAHAEIAESAILLDCSRGTDDPAVVALGEDLAHAFGVERMPSNLSDMPVQSLLANLGGKLDEALASGHPIRSRASGRSATGAPQAYRCRFLPLASAAGESAEAASAAVPDHVLTIITPIDQKEPSIMDRQDFNEERQAEEVLILDTELMTAADGGGETAVPREPGELLLDHELPAEPPVKSIDVRPRARKPGVADELYRRSGIDRSGSGSGKGWRAPLSSDKDSVSPSPLASARIPIAASTKPPSNATPLQGLLAEARELAAAYGAIEARTRSALYEALGRAHDFALAAEQAPEEYRALLEAAGIEAQDRAPLTPVVKLVFGPQYDPTRLAEFATVLAHCQRKGIARGAAAGFIASSEGGIKRMVQLERLLKRGEAGEPLERVVPRQAIARRLQRIDPVALDDLDNGEDEFVLVVARRMPDGGMGVLGAVPRDMGLLEKAARKLLAEQGRGVAAREPASEE